ncbi:MAG: hypothetical protein A3A24_03745 [Candidatus Buchananbacteria bacterium RIFCSPLOWO2_01_FULL_46_12]|uniref:SH3b domain-containing protein n=2 Tax=Candidatus Buchananiibacteriota TaxID=1817903 RepID=A0A1G1YT46_9BACT|nr:MAG: hypothetical protein A2744_01950 [Candidatus Buchananbacteria bacterium RIFCSPHIGHO2_01_FULL_44_11]OGY55542.1 MAG: hypothetical protein A3A24_03745 [Candidatus Buchananbacteria bacterium RIFCSPLOWO2_01_FULL_46_12]
MARNNIFGLDISDHSIEAVLIKKTFGRPKVAAYARTVLRGDVIRDGIIKNPERLAENIKKVLASGRPKPIRASRCILSLPDARAFTTIFKLPAGLKHSEIKNTIPYKAEEIIPFKSSEVYFDFKTIVRVDSTQEVFYAAVPTKVIDGYLDVLAKAGLTAVAFDLESISLARALVSPALINEAKKHLAKDSKKFDAAILLMDIGARVTNLNIFDRNGIRQSLSIKIAGNRFSKALAAKLSVTEHEAEALKIKVGFDSKQDKGRVALVLQKEFERLINETKKLINYYQEESGRRVGLVILAGGSSLLPGLDQHLTDNLGLPVKIGDILTKVNDPANLIKAKNKSVIFANVLGLGLRGISKSPAIGDINFLPLKKAGLKFKPLATDKLAWRLVYVRLAVLLVAAVVFVGLTIFKNRGFDLYQQVYPVPDYSTEVSADINYEALDQLRLQFMLDAATSTSTTTPTTTPAVIEAESLFTIKIKQTSAGYLNVRSGAGTNYPKIGQVDSGTELPVLAEQDNWYQIELIQEAVRQEGWVSASYVDKVEE